MIATWVAAWLVPVVLAVLVLVAAWVGVRWYSGEYVTALEHVPLFRPLNPRQRRAVARSISRQEFSPGSRIVTEGELEDGFFMLDAGSALVSVGGERKATLGPGAYFGEIAVIDRGPRSATITAEGRVTTLHLPAPAFSRLVESDPSIADAVARELRRRLGAAGASDPQAPTPVGRDDLVALCRELRSMQTPDWNPSPTGRRRSWWSR